MASQDWRELCAARLTRTLARKPRKKASRQWLASLPRREPVVVSPSDFVTRAEACLSEVAQLIRDAQRYADWEARGKPPSPTSPRKDRLRPRLRGRDPLRVKLYKAQGGICGLCRGVMESARDGTIDHVVPRALGGKNAGNVILAHEGCNNAKANRPPTRTELEMLLVVNAYLAGIETGTDETVKQGSVPKG